MNNCSCVVEHLQLFGRNTAIGWVSTAVVWAINCRCFIEHLQKSLRTIAVAGLNNCSCCTAQLQLFRRTTAVLEAKNCRYLGKRTAVVLQIICRSSTEKLQLFHRTIQPTIVVVSSNNATNNCSGTHNNWPNSCQCCTEQLRLLHRNNSARNCSRRI